MTMIFFSVFVLRTLTASNLGVSGQMLSENAKKKTFFNVNLVLCNNIPTWHNLPRSVVLHIGRILKISYIK